MAFIDSSESRIEPVRTLTRRTNGLTRSQIRWYRDVLASFLYHAGQLGMADVTEVLSLGIKERQLRNVLTKRGAVMALPSVIDMAGSSRDPEPLPAIGPDARPPGRRRARPAPRRAPTGRRRATSAGFQD
jgi:hypothetical protein